MKYIVVMIGLIWCESGAICAISKLIADFNKIARLGFEKFIFCCDIAVLFIFIVVNFIVIMEMVTSGGFI